MKLSTWTVFGSGILIGVAIPTFVEYARMGIMPPTHLLVIAGMSLLAAVVGTLFAEKN
ncbi:hypothetical protein K2P47_00495 [Patescibacteria group bacterium]|nr:hypothetical protein [Patescibacteria group bacterium]